MRAADEHQDARPVRPWSPLTFGQYRILWSASVFSVIGEQGRRAIDLYLVYQLSGGSAWQLGLLGGAQAVPLFVMGLFGGTLVDVFDRKMLLQAAQVVRVLLLLALTALVYTGTVQVWHIYLITVITGVAQVVDSPARTSLVPATVPRPHLLNAMALNSSTRQLGMLIGPPIATALIVPFGAYIAYAVQVGAYAVGIGALAFLSVKPLEARSLKGVRMADVTEGLTFVWKTRFLASVLVLDAFAVVLTSWRVLTPIFAINILHGTPSTIGLLLAAPAAGRVMGTVFLLVAKDIRRQGLFILTVTLGYAASVALFALSRQVWLSLALMTVVGATDGAGAIVRSTAVQMVAPEAIRGRVTSVSQIFAQGSPAVGQMATGAVAAVLGAPGALLLGAALAAGAAAFVGARIREILSFRAHE